MSEPLNTFEERLLGELTLAVTEPHALRRRRPSVKWLGIAAAGVAATAVGLGAVIAAPQPAWAVGSNPDGTVTITINRPEGAARLEKRLAELGIAADVQFPPEGRRCAPGRLPDSTVDDVNAIEAATIGRDQIELTVDPAKADGSTTLLIEVSILDKISPTESHGLVGILGSVEGTPEPCRLIPLTPRDVTADPAGAE
ncbi:MAG: hypothetical protein Q4G67_04790 [Actinomycetia bacterium]|nr:hypothetical protein [Actinomycetes bacterium]